MNIGKELRMSRLFHRESKRMVLITVDHGICINPTDPTAITRALCRLVHEEVSVDEALKEL